MIDAQKKAYERCVAVENDIKQRFASGLRPVPDDYARFVDEWLASWRDDFAIDWELID